jgi:hypothetical protein
MIRYSFASWLVKASVVQRLAKRSTLLACIDLIGIITTEINFRFKYGLIENIYPSLASPRTVPLSETGISMPNLKCRVLH